MRYWDASAIVPLVVDEAASLRVRGTLAEDEHIVTWTWTHTEIISAIERRTREGSFSRVQRGEALRLFEDLASRWDEVTDMIAVRSRANALLARHSLRAADAGHLGAALFVQAKSSEPLPFVCLDIRLSTAAGLEGLHVLP